MRERAEGGIAAKAVQVLRALTCAGALTAVTDAAVAQENDLASRLTAGLQCAYIDPAPHLASNIADAGAGPAEVVSALESLLADDRICQSIESAVSTALGELTANDEVVDNHENVLARQRMQATLREADQRIAAMRFVVGPPPPRLTRNGSSVP